MSFDFQILGSSSNGNSAFLTTPNTKILIDVGFSGKKIENLLSSIGQDINTIDAVFLTHEHSDHSSGVKGLSRKNHLRFFANRDTASSLQSKIVRSVNWHIFETGSTFQFKDLEITSFSIPHDAYDPVGYIFKYENRSLAWVTDLGYIPKFVQEKISQVEILILESNYDEILLNEDTKRPWSIKQRIKSRHGHLSNTAAFDFISTTKSHSWKQIYLAHLSRDCNDVRQLELLFSPLLCPKNPFKIQIVSPNEIF